MAEPISKTELVQLCDQLQKRLADSKGVDGFHFINLDGEEYRVFERGGKTTAIDIRRPGGGSQSNMRSPAYKPYWKALLGGMGC